MAIFMPQRSIATFINMFMLLLVLLLPRATKASCFGDQNSSQLQLNETMNIFTSLRTVTLTCIMPSVFILLLIPWMANSSSVGEQLAPQLPRYDTMMVQVPYKNTFVSPTAVHNRLNLRRCFSQTQLQNILQSLTRYDCIILYYGEHVTTFICERQSELKQSSSDGLKHYHTSFILPVTKVCARNVTDIQYMRNNELCSPSTEIWCPFIQCLTTGLYCYLE